VKTLQKDKYLYVFYRAFVVGELEHGSILTSTKRHCRITRMVEVKKWVSNEKRIGEEMT